MSKLLAQGNIAAASEEYLERRRRILASGETVRNRPPLNSSKRDKHKDAYAAASGNALGPHSSHGDWKPLEELVASWHLIFGREGALLCIWAIWTCGPPVILNDETLALWTASKLQIEPSGFTQHGANSAAS